MTNQKHLLATKIYFHLTETAVMLTISYNHTIHLLHLLLQCSHHLFLGVHLIQQSLKLLGKVTLKTVKIILHWDEWKERIVQRNHLIALKSIKKCFEPCSNFPKLDEMSDQCLINGQTAPSTGDRKYWLIAFFTKLTTSTACREQL